MLPLLAATDWTLDDIELHCELDTGVVYENLC